MGGYGPAVLHLSRQQQKVLATVLLLLVVGWAVKAWRLAENPLRMAPTDQETDAERELRRNR